MSNASEQVVSGSELPLTEFLLARIAEDEAAANRAGSFTPWGETFQNDNYGHLTIQPARVLAECEAKRAIVALHFEMDGGAPETYPYVAEDGRTVWPGCAVCDEGSPSRPHCDTVRILAAVYADHRDYRQEWVL